VAGDEDQAEEVVAHVVVERASGVGGGSLLLGAHVEVVAELIVLALEELAAAESIDRSILRGGHEPGAGILRDARFRPLLERREERILRELLGGVEVADEPREPGDERGRFHLPHRVDRGVRLTDRHDGESKHPGPRRARRPRRLRRYGFANSFICRTSLSPSPTTERKRLVHSTASAFERTWMIA